MLIRFCQWEVYVLLPYGKALTPWMSTALLPVFVCVCVHV